MTSVPDLIVHWNLICERRQGTVLMLYIWHIKCEYSTSLGLVTFVV